MTPVQATAFPTLDLLFASVEVPAAAGGFVLDGDDTLVYICPCGCQELRALPVYQGEQTTVPKRGWKWNGSINEPTLTPSIKHLDKCKWHGHLVKGVWEPCGDSGQ